MTPNDVKVTPKRFQSDSKIHVTIFPDCLVPFFSFFPSFALSRLSSVTLPFFHPALFIRSFDPSCPRSLFPSFLLFLFPPFLRSPLPSCFGSPFAISLFPFSSSLSFPTSGTNIVHGQVKAYTSQKWLGPRASKPRSLEVPRRDSRSDNNYFVPSLGAFATAEASGL